MKILGFVIFQQLWMRDVCEFAQEDVGAEWRFVIKRRRPSVAGKNFALLESLEILVLPVDFEWGPGYGHAYAAKVAEESEEVRSMMRARRRVADDNVISYTLENLASSTTHFFTIEALDEQEKVVDVQAGACTTKSQTPTAVENSESEQQVVTKKILYNGRIYILRGNKVYTVEGKALKQ